MTNVKTAPVRKSPVLSAQFYVINILVVVDTDAVKDYCAKNNIKISTNQGSPTSLPHAKGDNPDTDGLLQYMLCTGYRKSQQSGISGQGTGNLSFPANVKDYVQFMGISSSGNSNDAVIIYGIQPTDPNVNVFNKFQPNKTTLTGAALPDPNTETGLPAKPSTITYFDFGSQVANKGTELFWVQFAIYEMDDSGENQNLLGYFQWDPTITVK